MNGANALSVDVEDYFHVSAMATTIPHAEWTRWPSRVEQNTRQLLDLVDAAGVRATWFVLGWVAKRHPSLVPEIVSRGHEVACHGYSHRLVYEQTPAEFREETLRARDILVDQAQRPVLGYRAASYSITRKSLWALDILAECGFEYDSSIFPVRHDRYGIPDFPRWPHVMETPAGHRIVEVPLTTLRVAGMNIPIAGGGYFRLYPYGLTRACLRAVNRHDGEAFVFYLHPWEIDAEQPRVPGLSLRSRFRHYLNLARTKQRLERLVSDFPFQPMADLLEDRGLLPRRAADLASARACVTG